MVSVSIPSDVSDAHTVVCDTESLGSVVIRRSAVRTSCLLYCFHEQNMNINHIQEHKYSFYLLIVYRSRHAQRYAIYYTMNHKPSTVRLDIVSKHEQESKIMIEVYHHSAGTITN